MPRPYKDRTIVRIALRTEHFAMIQEAADRADKAVADFLKDVVVQHVILSAEKTSGPPKLSKGELAAQRRQRKKAISKLGDLHDQLMQKFKTMMEHGRVNHDPDDPEYKKRADLLVQFNEVWEKADAVSETAPLDELDAMIEEIAALEPAMLEAMQPPPLIPVYSIPKPQPKPKPLSEAERRAKLRDLKEQRHQFEFYAVPNWEAKVAQISKQIAELEDEGTA
jgi:hypothetical protein